MKIYDASGFSAKLTGSFSGSFKGNGSGLTGVLHNAGEIASEISGSVTELSASIATRFDGLTTNYTELDNIPSGIISSSAQFNALSNTSASFATTSSYAVTSLTASFALNADGNGFPFSGSADITGSLYVSGGTISGSFVGDGSQLTNINIVTQSLVEETFAVTGSHTVRHNFDTKNVITQVFDSNDFVISPSSIQTVDNNTVKVDFSTSESGRVVVVKGGHVVTALQSTNSSSYSETAVTSSNANLATLVHNNYLLSGSLNFWSGPKQVYDSISGSADPNTIYFVKE